MYSIIFTYFPFTVFENSEVWPSQRILSLTHLVLLIGLSSSKHCNLHHKDVQEIQNTWRGTQTIICMGQSRIFYIPWQHKGLQQRDHNVVSSQWHPKTPPESTDLIKPVHTTHPSKRSTAPWAGQDWPHSHLFCLGLSLKAVPAPTVTYRCKLFHTPGAKPATMSLSSNRRASTTGISSSKKCCLKAIIGQWVAMDENYSSLDYAPAGNKTMSRFQHCKLLKLKNLQFFFPVNSSFFSQWLLFGHSFSLAIRIWVGLSLIW